MLLRLGVLRRGVHWDSMERIIVHISVTTSQTSYFSGLHYVFTHKLQIKRRLCVLDFGRGSVIHEPIQLSVRTGSYPRRRERVMGWIIHDLRKNILLAFSCSHERDFARVVDNRICQRYPLGRRFRRVVQVGNPSTLFGQQCVPREQRGRVPIRSDTKQDKVEDREPCRVLLCELGDQLPLVRVGEFFKIVEEGGINVMNIFGWDGDFGEEDIIAEFVVGVFVVERHSSFIGVVDLPANPFSIQLPLMSARWIHTTSPI